MKYKKWDTEEENLVKIWCGQGWSIKDIAEELERTYCSVNSKIRELKIPYNSARYEILSNEEFDRRLKIKNPSFKRLEDYKGSLNTILFKCLTCGEEKKAIPASRLSGRGCHYCKTRNNSGNIGLNNSGITYLVHIPEYDINDKWFLKLGITAKTIKERFVDNKLSPARYEIILERHFDLGSDAMQLEAEWKSNVKEYLVNTRLLTSGNTETFLY